MSPEGYHERHIPVNIPRTSPEQLIPPRVLLHEPELSLDARVELDGGIYSIFDKSISFEHCHFRVTHNS